MTTPIPPTPLLREAARNTRALPEWFRAQQLSWFERVWRRLRRPPTVPVLLQSEVQECAHACLAMVVAYHGGNLTLRELRKRYTPATGGTRLSRLLEMAQDCGFGVRAFRIEPEQLPLLPLPCIVHWDLVHYVVVVRWEPARVLVNDPGSGQVWIPRAEFDRRFTGIAVELRAQTVLEGQQDRPGQTLAFLRSGLHGRQRPLLAILGLALLLEGMALLSPLLIQTVTDAVIPHSDLGLLGLLVAAFVALALLQEAFSGLRANLLIRLGESLDAGWNTAVFARLLKLPFGWFARRDIGDVQARLGSIDAIQRTLTTRFIESALDGVTVLLSLVLITLYSPMLAALTLGAAVVYALYRLASFPKLRLAEQEAITLKASQQSLLLETLHGIQSIKANNRDPVQMARYQGRSEDAARASARVQLAASQIARVGALVQRVHRICAIGLGGLLAIRGHLTVGMLVAYLAYADQFSTRTARLVDLITEWKMLRMHGDRLADIVDEPGEHDPEQPAHADGFAIVAQNLCFRYGADDPWILDGVSLTVAEGECVAIRGRSGSGKSTLAKLLVGLLDANRGTLRIGGVPVQTLGRRALRGMIGSVMQEDQLFNGSIAENIAFFEPDPDLERVREAAIAAQIDAEVLEMPLGYDSRIIDMGASLSGGQRQRLIIARALYRQPCILVLDEASSHLDVDNERRINTAISNLRITRIIIAHRPETLAIASRVLEMRDGRLIPSDGDEPAKASISSAATSPLA